MKKLLFPFLLFSLFSCTTKEENILYFDDFATAEKGNYSDIAMILSEKLAKRTDTTAIVVKFSNKRYDFHEEGAFTKEFYISNHDQDNPKKVAFFLNNLRNVTIDGQGASFVFHGRMIPFILTRSQNVKMTNFSIDFELPHLRQLEILTVDKKANEVTATIEPKGNYEIVNEKLIATGEGYEYQPNYAMAFRPDRRLTYMRGDVGFYPKSVTEVEPNILKIKNWEQIQYTEVGERFALRTSYRPTPGIVVDFCKDMVFENIQLHYAEGMGLLAQMTENITLDGFSVCLKGENDPRYFTTQADATHFSACKGLILSQNGLYEGMADDAINVHGTYLKIIKKINDHTVQAQYMHPQAWGFQWGEVGDTVQFIEALKMEVVSEKNYLKSLKSVDKETIVGAKVYELTFENRLPKQVVEGNYSIENLTWTPEVIFRNNTIRNNRARGTLFSTPRHVLCEGNTFDHTHGAAILLAGDSNGWYETGACNDVVIRGNKFRNALTANYQFTNAIISIYPEIPNLKEQKQFFHKNILIENNIFETFDQPLLYAKSTDGILFKGNKVVYNDEFEPFHWNKYMFFFEKVANVLIEGNDFERGLNPKKDIKITLSAGDAVKIIE